MVVLNFVRSEVVLGIKLRAPLLTTNQAVLPGESDLPEKERGKSQKDQKREKLAPSHGENYVKARSPGLPAMTSIMS